MIPLRLTVKNFMCYRDNAPMLDLESIHVACLCGDNGNGKTALLDAITWALWGEARTRTQEELIHQGQQDMLVELDFLAHDQIYRVSRRHSRSARSRQGTTILEFQVQSEDGFQPITGNTVRDTESRIRDILNLDYETFINTAFLIQGRADLFTSSPPARRKECLAEVLDLSYYESLEDDAKNSGREIQEQIRNIESGIELRRQELERKPQYEEELASVKATLEELAPQVEAQRRQVEELRRAVGLLEERRKELEGIDRYLSEAARDLDYWERQVSGSEARVMEYESALGREQEIREKFAEFKEATASLERLDEALARKSELDKERAGLEQAIAVQRERLSSRVELLRARVDNDLAPRAERHSNLDEGLRAARQEQEQLGQLEEDIQRRRLEAMEFEVELERLDEALEAKSNLELKKANLEQQLAVQKERLTSQEEQIRNRVNNELAPRAGRLEEVQEKLRQAGEEEEKLTTLSESIRQDRSRAEQIECRIRYLRQDNNHLLQEMEETRKKFDMLEQGEALCPLCQTSLSAEGVEHLRQEYEAQGMEGKRRYHANEQELAEMTSSHQGLSELISKAETELEQRRKDLHSRSATLSRDLEDAQKARAELETVYVQLEEVQARLHNQDFAQEVRFELSQVEEELSKLGYDSEVRSKVHRQFREATDHIAKMQSDYDRRRQECQSRISRLECDLKDSLKARDELEPARAELERMQQSLDAGDFAHEDRGRLSQLDAELAALGYDAEQHRRTRESARSLEHYGELHRKLEEALEQLPSARESRDTAKRMLERYRQEMRESEERRVALEDELKALPSKQAQMDQDEARLDELVQQRDAASVQQGVLERQLEHCDALEVEIGQQEQERHRLVGEKNIYDELALAFGKNGVQALIIESAIPQLEADANELLGRLTDNRMFLRLQLQEGRRDSRTKLPTEELDIKIADEVGTRSYETFSGGEAFRINFALRIALSKLLARRSGAPLPILFIDEGFGSQDRAGQERLTEAIQSIQDDFQKIIVITHVEQIKEAFPVRIEVTKTESGSAFQVV